MIMAIDVSNTNITLGTFKGEKLLKIYRVTTKVPRTSDEYGVLLRDLVMALTPGGSCGVCRRASAK